MRWLAVALSSMLVIGTVLYTLTLLVAMFVDGHVSTLWEGRRMHNAISMGSMTT